MHDLVPAITNHESRIKNRRSAERIPDSQEHRSARVAYEHRRVRCEREGYLTIGDVVQLVAQRGEVEPAGCDRFELAVNDREQPNLLDRHVAALREVREVV